MGNRGRSRNRRRGCGVEAKRNRRRIGEGTWQIYLCPRSIDQVFPFPRLCYQQSPYTVVEAVVAFNHGAKGEEKAVAAFVDCPYGAPGKERERERNRNAEAEEEKTLESEQKGEEKRQINGGKKCLHCRSLSPPRINAKYFPDLPSYDSSKSRRRTPFHRGGHCCVLLLWRPCLPPPFNGAAPGRMSSPMIQ